MKRKELFSAQPTSEQSRGPALRRSGAGPALYRSGSGFIALISVLIISSLLLLIGTGLCLSSLNEGQISLSEQLSAKSFFLAQACAEYALIQLKNNLDYPGDETVVLEEGSSCSVLPLEGSGNDNRIIKTESSFKNYFKKVKIEVAQVNPLAQITSWREVADF